MAKKPLPPAGDLAHITEQLRPLAVPLDTLTPDPANARLHGADNLAGIQGSLRAYGQRKPVVVNRRTGCVEAGNGTLEAARALGWTHVAAVYVDDDAMTATGFALADNRTAELASWDTEALGQLLGELRVEDKDLAAMLKGMDKLLPKDSAEVGPGGAQDIPEKFEVVVECDGEGHQRELYERLTGEGLVCRVLTV